MDTYEGWAPDPFERHEVRYYVDGRPTKLVRDGSVEAFDDLPPRSTWPDDLLAAQTVTATSAERTAPSPPPPPAVEAITSQLTPPPVEAITSPPPPPPYLSPPPPPPLGTSYWSPPPPPGPPDVPHAGVPAFGSTASVEDFGEPAGLGTHLPDTFVGGVDPAPIRRPRKRLITSMVAVVVLAAAGSAVAALSGSKSAEAAVIDSVNNTMADRTAHVTMDMTLNTPSSTLTASGAGGIDFSQNALQMQMTVNTAGQQVPITALYIGGSVYEQFAGLDRLIPGKSWISIDFGSAATSSQGSGALGTGNNPTAMLRLLALRGNTVVALGSSTIDGTLVEGYSVKLNAATIEAQLAHANLPSWMASALSKINIHSVTSKVYIDNSGLLRRYSVAMTESVASQGNVSLDESLDFSAYGTPVSVSAPPADQVVGFQQFLQAAEAAAGSAPT